MIWSLGAIIIIGLSVDWLFKKFRIPGLTGMILAGIGLGPYVFGFLSTDIINISSDLRLIALIIILLRAGFELSKDTLNKVGKMALKLSFIPASFEAIAYTLLAPHFLGLTYTESAMLGFVLSAVSPAVVVPLMMHFIEKRKGVEKGIPTLILAGASLDDVYTITVLMVILGIYTGNKVNLLWEFASIPISVILGISVGLLAGYLIYKLFNRFNPRATRQVLIILGVSIFMVQLERLMQGKVPFTGLLAVMAIGAIILEMDEHNAHKISAKLGKIWIFAEIILFVLVGAQVNIPVALKAGFTGASLIGLALISRSIGTYICVMGSNLNFKERMFVVISYIPKATVQAAIGGVPLLAMKLKGMNTVQGEIILAVAVLSILLTAPLGAFAISISGDRLLETAPISAHQDIDAAIESDTSED
ncbi:cation:proton antiporter [Candidatus Poribacteria bacterium]|nr:cation:proton antiporter [Candidatus Poribacteria bacterium]